jgi:hypothetical protein
MNPFFTYDPYDSPLPEPNKQPPRPITPSFKIQEFHRRINEELQKHYEFVKSLDKNKDKDRKKDKENTLNKSKKLTETILKYTNDE